MDEMLNSPDYLNYLESFLTESRKVKFLEVLQSRTNHFTVAIEDVYQMHNTSAVMRSCDVFGLQELHVVEQKYGKKIDAQIAMGAQKWVDVYQYQSNQSCLKALKNKGYQIVATTPHSDSCLLADFDISVKSAFFFGTERDGLSDEIMNQADCFLKIPMVGFTESLNISVAAAIILQHLTDRLRKSSIEWKLTEDEIIKKRMDWAKKSIKSIDDIEKRWKEMTVK
ncbi:TrmH family RNA methyltransferase [Flavobacterium sp.]|uniref:TrmH family RNA methyltransferase n=1 Tax=Flavobacterium sp. TaxID=239 RepID=UPI003526FC42